MKKAKRKRSRARKFSLRASLLLLVGLVAWGWTANWFVHHPRVWLEQQRAALPAFVTQALVQTGNPLADLTDALDLTGYDTVYEYDIEAPAGKVFFAGAPARVASPAPADIRVYNRGPFAIGWSDTLRHAVWVAYHVRPEARWPDGKRPAFLVDREIARAPRPSDFTKSGYDRGHMAPNHAIVTRYGADAQRDTFLMGNIIAQAPALNRGIWRDFEHRIADLWTRRYGEIWVVVGALPSPTKQTIGQTGIDIPSQFYQVILAQEGMDVRALAILVPQDVAWDAYAARHIVSIAELEALTGLNFNPELPSFISDPLEAECPNRLWPIRKSDILDFLWSRLNRF